MATGKWTEQKVGCDSFDATHAVSTDAWTQPERILTVNSSTAKVTCTGDAKAPSTSDTLRAHGLGFSETGGGGGTLRVPAASRVKDIEVTSDNTWDLDAGATDATVYWGVYINSTDSDTYSQVLGSVSADYIVPNGPMWGLGLKTITGVMTHSTAFGVTAYMTGQTGNRPGIDGYKVRVQWAWFIEPDNLDVDCTLGDVTLTKNSRLGFGYDIAAINPELVTDTAWINGDGWTHDGINDEFDYVYGAADGNFAQINVIAPSRSAIGYSFTVANWVSGRTGFSLTNLVTTVESELVDGDGVYSGQVISNSTGQSIYSFLGRDVGAQFSVTRGDFWLASLYPITFGDVGFTYNTGGAELPVDTMAVSVTLNDTDLAKTSYLDVATTLAISVAFGDVGLTLNKAVVADTLAVSIALGLVGFTAKRLLSTDSMAVAVNFGTVDLRLNKRIGADTLPIAVTTNPVGLLASRYVGMDQLDVAATLNDVGLNYNPANTSTLPVDTMAISVGLGDVDLRANRFVSLDQASIDVSLGDVGFLNHRSVSFDTASFTITLNDVGLSTNTHITVDAMAINATLNAVDLNYNPANQSTLPVDTMAISASLGDVGLRANRVLSANQVDYSVTLNDVSLDFTGANSYPLPVDTLAVSVGLGDVGLTAHRSIGIDQTDYTVTLNNVDLQRSLGVSLDTLPVSVGLGNVSLIAHRALPVDAPAYNITLNDVDLDKGYTVALNQMALSTGLGNVSLSARRILGADTLPIDVTLEDVALKSHVIQAVNTLTVTSTFNAVALHVRRVLGADPLSIVVAANDVDFYKHSFIGANSMPIDVTLNDVILFSGENLLPDPGTEIYITARSGVINSGSRLRYVHARVKNATILASIKE